NPEVRPSYPTALYSGATALESDSYVVQVEDLSLDALDIRWAYVHGYFYSGSGVDVAEITEMPISTMTPVGITVNYIGPEPKPGPPMCWPEPGPGPHSKARAHPRPGKKLLTRPAGRARPGLLDTVISDSTNQHPKSVVDVTFFFLVSWESKTCNIAPQGRCSCSPLPCHPPLRATAGNTPSCWAGPAGCASSLQLPGVCAPDGGREQQRGWLTSGRGKMAAVVGPQRGAQLNQAS
ncbi:hypothetical protein HPB47_018783, partial [Ixodes persulcatus]